MTYRIVEWNRANVSGDSPKVLGATAWLYWVSGSVPVTVAVSKAILVSLSALFSKWHVEWNILKFGTRDTLMTCMRCLWLWTLGSFSVLVAVYFTQNQVALAKQIAILDSGGTSGTYICYLRPFSVQCQFEVIQCTFLKISLSF